MVIADNCDKTETARLEESIDQDKRLLWYLINNGMNGDPVYVRYATDVVLVDLNSSEDRNPQRRERKCMRRIVITSSDE